MTRRDVNSMPRPDVDVFLDGQLKGTMRDAQNVLEIESVNAGPHSLVLLAKNRANEIIDRKAIEFSSTASAAASTGTTTDTTRRIVVDRRRLGPDGQARGDDGHDGRLVGARRPGGDTAVRVRAAEHERASAVDDDRAGAASPGAAARDAAPHASGNVDLGSEPRARGRRPAARRIPRAAPGRLALSWTSRRRVPGFRDASLLRAQEREPAGSAACSFWPVPCSQPARHST